MNAIEATRHSFARQVPYAGVAFLIFAGYVIGLWAWSNLAPTSLWFDARQIVVSDTVVGKAPRVQPQRTINRPFWADWYVTVYRLDGNGNPSVLCGSHGGNDYNPEAKVPADADLIWWMRDKGVCTAEVVARPGVYRIYSRWEIKPKGYSVRFVGLWSNPFVVHPVTSDYSEMMNARPLALAELP